MPSIDYPFNPWQDIVACDIKNEYVKITADNTSKLFAPRATPFHFNNLVVKTKDENSPPENPTYTNLVLGVDYFVTTPFTEFTSKYNKVSYGSIGLINKTTEIELYLDYSTVGKPFTLDETEFATYIFNLNENPRTVKWSQLVNLPSVWPPIPHPHPFEFMLTTGDIMDMMVNLLQAIEGINNSSTAMGLLKQHEEAELAEAHTAEQADVGLSELQNYKYAIETDLPGSAKLHLTLDIVKILVRKMMNGEIN